MKIIVANCCSPIETTVTATATTWIVWSFRSKGCLHPPQQLRTPVITFSGSHWYLAMPCRWGQTKPKQLSMAAAARVMWLCARVRYWPYRTRLNWPTFLIGKSVRIRLWFFCFNYNEVISRKSVFKVAACIADLAAVEIITFSEFSNTALVSL